MPSNTIRAALIAGLTPLIAVPASAQDGDSLPDAGLAAQPTTPQGPKIEMAPLPESLSFSPYVVKIPLKFANIHPDVVILRFTCEFLQKGLHIAFGRVEFGVPAGAGAFDGIVAVDMEPNESLWNKSDAATPTKYECKLELRTAESSYMPPNSGDKNTPWRWVKPGFGPHETLPGRVDGVVPTSAFQLPAATLSGGGGAGPVKIAE